MRLRVCKISISLLIVLLVLASLSFAAIVSAQYYPLSQNRLTTYVNYTGAGYVTPSGSNLYYYGSIVTVRAYTYTGYVFDGWYLNGIYQGKLSTITLTMTQDYTLYAVFSQRTTILTINANPSYGGTTAPNSGLMNCSYGSTITVTEYPAQGYTFSGWYLDGTYQGRGTSITVTMTQDHQLSAFFAGNGSNPTPPPTPTPTPMPTLRPTPTLPMPTLSFYCASSTTASGFNVRIQGALAYNGTGISGTGIIFSYSATGGATWHDLAYIITGNDGNFSAVWMPSASGNYIVKGTWLSDGIYSSVSTAVNFSVAPNPNQNQVFSVSSNSTLSSLTFDSTKNQLSFSVSGPSGTTGYVQACIPKSLLTIASNLKVSIDGQNVTYHTYSEGDAWMVTMEYAHSTHTLIMTLDAPASTPTPTTNPTSTLNPTQGPTPTTNPTSNPTMNPTQTANPTPTPSVPEMTPFVILPLIVVMLGLGIFVMIKKRSKVVA